MMKVAHPKRSILLSDSIVSKFGTRRWIDVNEISDGQNSATNEVLDFCAKIRFV